MKNKEIMDAYNNLALLKQRNAVAFPANISYTISRNMRVLEAYAQDIVEAKQEIINRYYEPVVDEPGMFLPKPDMAEKGRTELENLGNVENEVNILRFSLEALDGLNLSLDDMDALYFMIKED